ncbi:MAG: hypothetical protein IVW55_12315 [Chloroflexi bacterium]|nr:hypothetical protein [Chloroflexota bacterium]
MAQVYQPKKTSTKLIEGAVAGLIGGIVTILVMAIADFIITPPPPSTPSPYTINSGIWWLTPSAIGSLVTGQSQSNQDLLDSSYFVGLLLILAAFVILGIGFGQYRPLFRIFKINPVLGGAIYGAFVWLAVFFLFLRSISPATGRINSVAFLVAMILGGAALGWWASRPAPAPASAPGQA